MLFRRARSETVDSASAEDRSSSSRRFFLLKADSVGNQLIQETAATGPIIEAAPVHLSPRSPPPPYDTQSDVNQLTAFFSIFSN